MDIRTIIKIDALIQRADTGSPKQLGERLDLSDRAVYKYLKFMKEKLNAPIEYSKFFSTYKYVQKGSFEFKWKQK